MDDQIVASSKGQVPHSYRVQKSIQRTNQPTNPSIISVSTHTWSYLVDSMVINDELNDFRLIQIVTAIQILPSLLKTTKYSHAITLIIL